MNKDYDWSNPQPAFLNKPVQRIAVCCYGQYRTGDYCLPIIKKFYEATGVRVDFFCSLKTYTTYDTRRNWLKDTNKPAVGYTESVDIDYQLAQIEKLLQPRIKKCLTAQEEKQLVAQPNPIEQGWVDSIMLKQLYETEQNFVYDLVFMQRYDTLTWPFNFAELLVKGISNQSLTHEDSLHTSDSDFIFADTINTKIQWADNGVGSYADVLQDISTIGSSRALDVIAYEFLNNLPSKYIHTAKYRGYQTINYGYNIHHSFPAAIKNNKISQYRFPLLSESEIYFNDRRSQGRRWPMTIPVRQVDQMIDYELDTIQDNAVYEPIVRFYKKVWNSQR